jgi:N utilization substance protein B
VALELAVYELLYERSAPVAVIINEAVDLAKTFGSETSGRFVNGVLGTIAEELERQAHPSNP